MRWAAYDDLIKAATGDVDDLRAARDRWSGLSGRVHVDHELYGERSDAFVEWYVLERPRADGLRPVDRVAMEAGVPVEDREAVLALSRSYRSLFQVRRLRTGGVLIDDL